MFRATAQKALKSAASRLTPRGGGLATRRNMSGGGSIEEEIAEMNKWRTVTFLAIPACAAFGVYSFATAEHGHGEEQPAYSYLKRRSREQWPWGGDLGLFEYPHKEDGGH
ncbi:unnamed protein product [Bathycoccus prasinos]|mmetsp:Transcript_9045/g.29141  ORF Transcript_9045/g.29141 Transcript_9045/m.29141 type:complete len:110 (-) Transcript_9045:2347-2676(-)